MGRRYAGWMPKQARASDIRPDIGRRLKAARAVVYPSAAACARALQVPKNTWQNYESAVRYPDPFHLVRFCDATGFTMDFIYRGHLRGIAEDVQIRLAAEHPGLVDAAPDVGRPAKVMVPA
jgi:transcriptional regulator with XRE-family HTH domain